MRMMLNIVLAVFLLIVIAVIAVIVLLGSQFVEVELPEIQPPQPEPPPAVQPQLGPDMARYFELKNMSCGTLSGNFQIVMNDASSAEMSGLVPSMPEEEQVAGIIVDSYMFNQTIRTYVRGDWMKKVIVDNPELTTLWKNDRIYECAGADCTMRLMSDAESEDYYAALSDIRTNCIYFGKVPLPESANISRLLTMEKTGIETRGASTCENFLITANSTYARELMGEENLSEKQSALLWALANLAAPVQECLDEGTGIIAYRNVTLNLTKSYVFDYEPGGHFIANQQTELLYFSKNVPESFLGLPE